MLNSFRNNNTKETENICNDINETMSKKTIFDATQKYQNNNQQYTDNVTGTDPSENIGKNNQVSLSSILGGNKTELKPKHSNLADVQIFDNYGNLYLENMLFPLIITAVGKTASGKSVAIKNLIYNYAKLGYFKFILAIVPSKFNCGYDYLPDKYVIESYNENYLKNYFTKLKEFKQKSGFIPANALILDDVMGSINFYSPFWQHFISTYRHYNCTVIFGTQSITGKGGVSTLLRQCCNICIMYRNVYQDNIKNLYESFGTLMENHDEFTKTFLNVTSIKYHALMFVNDREDKESSYYDYISEVAPDFKMNY